MTTLQQLSQTTVQLLLEEPFYAHLLSGLIKQEEEGVPTLAVGLHEQEQLVLHVNPGFWAGLSEERHRYGVLKHELLHIALGHLFLAQAYPHKPLFNIAADLVVNQYIRRGRLPDGALRIERFQELQLERHKAVGYYYQALLELHRRGPDTADGQMLQDWMSGAAEDWQQRHRLWHQLGRIRQAERDNLRQQIDQILRSIAQKVGQREIGKLPASLRDLDKVTHYFKEPYPYALQQVAIIGGANSAAKAALSCYRNDAEVTLIVRDDAIGDTVKYWIKPDLENRIKEGPGPKPLRT